MGGGILPVDMSPHTDSSLSRFCIVEYVSHSEKSSFSVPSRTCRAIHQETGGTWLYQGQSVWLEWQFPQARTKTCGGSEFGESRSPRFLGSMAARCWVLTCTTIAATAINAAIDFSVLAIEFYPWRRTA
jgi:hypothetical protein